MPGEPILPRETIVQALVTALEPLDFVDAFWEAGAAAFGRVDPWSDLDLYVVVDDARVDETFGAVESTLERLSPILIRYTPVHPPESGMAQAFYRLARTTEYQLIDLAVFKRSARDKYLEPELHGRAVFAFNKRDLRPPPLDADGFLEALWARKERMRTRVELFHCFVQKELNRGNLLEAIDVYRGLVLDSLVEALRMKHCPVHYAFKMRYVHYELPPAVVQRLESLYFVRDARDLKAKYREATRWFQETVDSLVSADIRRALTATQAEARKAA